jgi:hypothetical protein
MYSGLKVLNSNPPICSRSRLHRLKRGGVRHRHARREDLSVGLQMRAQRLLRHEDLLSRIHCNPWSLAFDERSSGPLPDQKRKLPSKRAVARSAQAASPWGLW